MSFKVYQPNRIETNPLEEGQAAIDKGGTARFRREDLASVGITDRVVLLTDEGTLRVAIRKPRSGETANAMKVTVNKTGSKTALTRAHVRLAGAIRDLRLELSATKGRYPMTTKDDLLILNLAGCKAGAGVDDEENEDGAGVPAAKNAKK